MTDLEVKEFLDIVRLGSKNHYEALGVKPLSNFDKVVWQNKWQDRYDYAKKEFDKENQTKAHQIISDAKKILFSKKNKYEYDIKLKLDFERNLNERIADFTKKDKEFDNFEREIIEEKGKYYGFSNSEIHNLIEEQRKIIGFKDSSSSKQNQASTTTTKSGSPTLEIHNNSNFKKNGEFIFDNVKLTETRREIITIKNGGGGTLDAEAKFSAKWIEVIPKKIHQSKLPQDVTIIVNPSKDRSLKNGSAVMDTINLNYPSTGGTVSVPIVVKMAVEGHHSLVKRQSKYATIISSVLAGLMLLYIFSNYDFSGWAIFGFVISAIAIGIGTFAAIESEKNMGGLIIGGIILLITNWTIFALLSTVIITFYVAKFVFRKNPFRNEFIAAIPISSFIIFLLLFFSASNLRYSDYNNQRNYNNTTTQQRTYQPTTNSINSYAYIKPTMGRIRSGTSINYSILAELSKGTQLYVIEQDKATNWYKVRYDNNKIGYASNKIIDFNYVAPNKNNTASSSNSTNTSTTAKRLSSSLFLGNWNIDNGRSKYKFYKNYKGEYINSRGKLISFRWSYSNNYLKIILNTDNSVWNWKINSFSENRINMYSSKNKTYRTITKS
jgi:hypothetical protein